jgi:hypothetical protein
MKRVEDWLLRLLQRRCQHPGRMVAVDILEGTADGIEVRYCNRCGAISPDYIKQAGVRQFPKLAASWRLPDPNLWRG